MRALPQRNGTDGPPHLTRARLALPITFREETKTADVTILPRNKKYVNLKTYIIIIYFY
jgi:hypothetical protein